MKAKEAIALLCERLIKELLPEVRILSGVVPKRIKQPKQGDPEHFVLLISD